jgi:hypothetical protein
MWRINKPFAWIVIIAFLAIISRLVLTRYYWVPSIIRFHLADFGFPAVFTFFVSSFINACSPVRFRDMHWRGLRWTYLIVALAGMIQGLRIEYEDLVGEEQSDFDIGVLISKFSGTANTETFDWWDVFAICLGGLLVLYLQWQSTRHIQLWRRFPLFLKE